MGFWKFGKSSPEDEEHKLRLKAAREAELARQERDLVDLKHGGIPMQARTRLSELKDASGVFSSNLAPDELALLRRKSYRARGTVTGSAMFHVGQLFASSNTDCEIKELSEAYNEAYRLAVSRIRAELNMLGAHGVLGVRMNIMSHEFAEKTIEVQIVGTAVDGPGERPANPWLSDLSAQEWFALERAGYEPVGLVWGHCAWWLLTSYNDENIERSWMNTELTHWSDGLARARNIAIMQVITQARALGGHGVVGVSLNRRVDHLRLTGGSGPVYERMHHSILFSVVGTAVKASGNEAKKVQETVNVLSLRDGRLRPAIMKQDRDFSIES